MLADRLSFFFEPFASWHASTKRLVTKGPSGISQLIRLAHFSGVRCAKLNFLIDEFRTSGSKNKGCWSDLVLFRLEGVHNRA